MKSPRNGAADSGGPAGGDVPRRADWTRSRAKILQAAAAVFAEKGYRRSSTLDVAEAAEVAEATVFRHFPTKAELFEQAVIAPLESAVSEVATARSGLDAEVSTQEGSYVLYHQLLSALHEDARLLTAALSALTFESDTANFERLQGAFSHLLDYLDNAMRHRASQRGFRTDPELSVRLMVAMALGTTLAETMLFHDRSTPSIDDLSSAMAEFTAFGLSGRPEPP